MDQPRTPHNLQGLLRFAMEHTKSEDHTTESTYEQLDPEKKEFLDKALKSMTVDVIEEFRKAIETLENEKSTNDERLQALNAIREFIDNLDFANSFIKLGGSNILLKYLKSDEIPQRVVAIYTVAEMSQNNPFAQQHFTDAQVIPLLTQYFNESNEELVCSSVHAVSALIRNYRPGLIEFLKVGGIIALLKCLNTNNTRAFIKAVFLIACLSLESADVRDEFVKKSTIPVLWKYVEQPADGFDVKIETVLYALSELTKSPQKRLDDNLKNIMVNLLTEIICQNEKLPQSEETVAYARLALENITK